VTQSPYKFATFPNKFFECNFAETYFPKSKKTTSESAIYVVITTLIYNKMSIRTYRIDVVIVEYSLLKIIRRNTQEVEAFQNAVYRFDWVTSIPWVTS